MTARNGCLLLALLTLLSACSREDRAEAALDGGEAVSEVAPPILPPGDTADPAQPPSYEVSIASAASDHNKAINRCTRQPESVRTQCEQEANAAFADVEASLEPLRGNQQ
jgi:uncharacterized lipoprotein